MYSLPRHVRDYIHARPPARHIRTPPAARRYLKPGRGWSGDAPRATLIKDADPHVWFVLGLGPGFACGVAAGSDDAAATDDEDEAADADAESKQEALDALSDAVAVDEGVVGFFANLDYTVGMTSRPVEIPTLSNR